jgi:hypothetical protein
MGHMGSSCVVDTAGVVLPYLLSQGPIPPQQRTIKHWLLVVVLVGLLKAN